MKVILRESVNIILYRGVTAYRRHDGMGSKGVITDEQEILFCVVTRLEIGNIKTVVREINPTAFITMHSLSDVEGGLIKKTALH
ncbi:MAG: DUF2179 domain-containing protein [Acidobacteriota bacterium]|nr:DUF2179 domain-containing protein [Acidobacteriota bacterium]